MIYLTNTLSLALFLGVGFSTLYLSICSSMPSLNPPPLQHGQWIPRIDSDRINYHQQTSLDDQNWQTTQIKSSPHLYPQQKFGPVSVYRRVQSVPVRNQWPNKKSPIQYQQSIVTQAPEPMPRNDDGFEKKAGLSFLSSLIPRPILDLPQSEGQSSSDTSQQQHESPSESDNFIEADPSNNNNPLSLFNSITDNNAESLLQQHQQSYFPSEAQSNYGNLGDASHPSLTQFLNEQLTSTNSKAPDFDAETPDSENDEANNDGGILTKIRNIIPLGQGFISGLLSNDSNAVGYPESSNGNEVNDMNPNLPSFNNLFPSSTEPAPNQEVEESPENPNVFSGQNRFPTIFPSFPGLISSTMNDEEASPNLTEDDSEETQNETGFSFLPSLPNPFQKLRDFFSTFKIPSIENEGGYDNNGPVDVTQSLEPMLSFSTNGEDISVTPLQSLVNGGVGGVLGPVLKIISKIKDTYSLSAAQISKLKVGAIVLGPIFSAALAAMIVGIVYISVYIPAWAIRNEVLDGDFYFIPFNRLLNILGVPNPLEEIFGFRSFDGRSNSVANSTFENYADGKRHINGTLHAPSQCAERLACEVIGRKLLQRHWWKDGYIAKGIKLLSNKKKLKMKPRAESNWPSVRATVSFIDAVATGFLDETLTSANKESRHNLNTPCAKYVCNPIQILQNFVTLKNNATVSNEKSSDIVKNLVNNVVPPPNIAFTNLTVS